MLLRTGGQDSLNARLDGPDGSSITWGLRDPVDAAGWGASRVATVTKLLPHIRQFVRVRQALVRAEARDTTVTALLDNPRIGVVHLDRRGRLLAANDRARVILRRGDGLTDRSGMLGARAPADQARLERMLGAALPGAGPTTVSGSMLLRRSAVLPPFVVHVKPVRVAQPDYGARHVAALVLSVEPGRQPRIRPERVALTLGLTPAEAQVAVWLAEGKSVRDMAEATGHTEGGHLLALEADLPEAVPLAAGRPGAVGPVARRARVRRRRIRSRCARCRRANPGPPSGSYTFVVLGTARRSTCACSSVPPFRQVRCDPRCRNVWQHVADVAASGHPLSLFPDRSAIGNGGGLASSRPQAATYASTVSSARHPHSRADPRSCRPARSRAPGPATRRPSPCRSGRGAPAPPVFSAGVAPTALRHRRGRPASVRS